MTKFLKFLLLGAVAVLALGSGGVEANAFKLSINEDQNPNNVVIFDGSMRGTVTHTGEGMEISIPGVEVNMRCKSNANGTTSSCTIALEALSVASSGTPQDPDCVQGTWNNCDTNPDPEPEPEPDPDPDPVNCTTTGSVKCLATDYGSAGADSTGNRDQLELQPSLTYVMPFSTNALAGQTGSVAIAPTTFGTTDDGSNVRMWISKASVGDPVGARCAITPGFSASISYSQQAAFNQCILSPSTRYFLNVTLCISGPSDLTCAAADARPGSESIPIYIKGSK